LQIKEYSNDGDYIIFLLFAITQDGKKAAINVYDQNILILDLKTQLILQEFEGTGNRFDAIAITPDGSRVIAGGNGLLFAWDTISGDILLQEETDYYSTNYNHLAISPCGRRAVSAGDDHRLAVWNLDTGCKITSLTGEYEFSCVAISDDGTRIAAGDSGGFVYLLKLENTPNLEVF